MLGTFANETSILTQVPMHFDDAPPVSVIKRKLNVFEAASSREQMQRLRVRDPRSSMVRAPLIDDALPGIQLINQPCMRSHPIYKDLAASPVVDYTEANTQGSMRHYRKRKQYPVYELSSIVDEISSTSTFSKGTGAGVDRFGQVPFIRSQNRRVVFTESPDNLQFIPKGRLPSVSPLIGKRTAVRYR